jgi:hypothetical protein
MTRNTKTKSQPIAAPVQTERPHEGLTETQEQLAELATDMLLRGGARSDIDLLLGGLARHRRRRLLSCLRKGSGQQSEKELDEEVARGEGDIDGWYRQLAKEWPTERRPERPEKAFEGLSVAARIAVADVRGQLADQFDQYLFITMKGIESAYLLNEIMEYVNSCGFEVPEAFAAVIDHDSGYVRVPADLKEQVVKFIALLQKRAA